MDALKYLDNIIQNKGNNSDDWYNLLNILKKDRNE